MHHLWVELVLRTVPLQASGPSQTRLRQPCAAAAARQPAAPQQCGTCPLLAAVQVVVSDVGATIPGVSLGPTLQRFLLDLARAVAGEQQ